MKIRTNAFQNGLALSDPKHDNNVIEVIEEDLQVGKTAVERGRMRIYSVVTERDVQQDISLSNGVYGAYATEAGMVSSASVPDPSSLHTASLPPTSLARSCMPGKP